MRRRGSITLPVLDPLALAGQASLYRKRGAQRTVALLLGPPPTTITTTTTTTIHPPQRVTDCGDNGNNNIVLRRSADGGSTWGPVLPVVMGEGAISNPNPVEVSMDGNKLILLHYDTMNNPSSSSHGLNMQTWSMDDGLTWSSPEDVSEFMPADVS